MIWNAFRNAISWSFAKTTQTRFSSTDEAAKDWNGFWTFFRAFQLPRPLTLELPDDRE
jgi:hypothetical protein